MEKHWEVLKIVPSTHKFSEECKISGSHAQSSRLSPLFLFKSLTGGIQIIIFNISFKIC